MSNRSETIDQTEDLYHKIIHNVKEKIKEQFTFEGISDEAAEALVEVNLIIFIIFNYK